MGRSPSRRSSASSPTCPPSRTPSPTSSGSWAARIPGWITTGGRSPTARSAWPAAWSRAGTRCLIRSRLPHRHAQRRMPTAESPVDLQRLAEDCVAAAGEAVDWSRYVGLNLVFNADLDRPRGSEVCLALNGGSKCFRTTWLWPGWYHNQSIWAHEMGHTFGLNHSSVGNGNGYGNMWDVMSVDGPCRTEPPYGRIGQHPIAYQKDILGWIPAERIFVAEPDSQATITLEQTAAPEPGNYVLARIPIRELARSRPVRANGRAGRVGADRHYYTVEARRRTGYDASLPGDAVIIHEVNLDGDPQVRPVSTAVGGSVSLGGTTGSAASGCPASSSAMHKTVSRYRLTAPRPPASWLPSSPVRCPRTVLIRERGIPAEDVGRHAPRCTARAAARPNRSRWQPRAAPTRSGRRLRPKPAMGSCRRVRGARTSVFAYRPAGGDWGPGSGSTTTVGIPARIRPSRSIARGTRMQPGWTTATATRPSTRPPGPWEANGARMSSSAAARPTATPG